MSSSNGKRPLVADKRATSRKPKSKPAPARAKKPRRVRAASRNPVVWLFRAVVRLVWGVGWRVGALVLIVTALAVIYYAATLPPVSALVDGRSRGSVTLLDRDNKVFAWRGEQFGGQISADTVSPHLRNAVVATEDKRFYGHFGLSPRGIASAVRINLAEGRGPLSGNGGSTITQQVAKLLCLGVPYSPESGMTEAEYETECRRTTLGRKVKEAVYAMAMELRYSKDDILSIYLNRAYLGAGARGFEAAAQRYFGRSANELLPSEAAMLAGLLKAPSRYAPTANLQLSRDRAATIVKLMEEQGYLTAAEAEEARRTPATLSEAAEARAGGYFADWVMDMGPTFLTEETTEDVVIQTTFDQRIQKAAEEGLQYIFDNKVRDGSEAQAAIVVMSADGAVRAMVGGRKFKGVAGQFNRAIQAKRQTGSAFKPFVYAAALDMGFPPNTTVRDEPYCLDVPGSGEWCPENYTRTFAGTVTLTQALAQSLNIPAVKVFERVGREAVVKIAADFGLASDIAVGPAVALGSSESTLLEMTRAYAGILNGGSSVDPYGLIELRLKGEEKPLLVQEGGIGERVIQEGAARQLTFMMHQAMEVGTGTRARLEGRPAAGKTGTTSASRDAWFVGFTADYVAGVWMGYDDNTPLTGVTGGGLPAEIWHEVMTRVHEGLPVHELPMEAPQAVAQQAEPRRQQPTRNQPGNQTERVIINILNELFGSR
ncbi:PBP1A family penicillin-binding protein [Silicimonas algicola]|uniref:peptidoglycan glycosyltransferase n=1 Tax=Silicimonas algicola TaxID=1826607 RepID=A0A316G5Q3_9RHOB|nr:PBP1A family penicillin-binding protein [Silicimonas algicola]AZQ68735.1 PBP1A family penicillin-binding protein [Silicimonas algicola]PWK56188.1 1A family penicillin-binding protein [Silicimonas algicola]